MTRAYSFCAAAIALVLLGACGKKAQLREPDDASAPYTYPKTYPNPAGVGAGSAGPGTAAKKPASREAPSGVGTISVEPITRRKTTIYGTPSE